MLVDNVSNKNDGSRDKNIPKLLEKPVADTRLHAFYGRWNLYDN